MCVVRLPRNAQCRVPVFAFVKYIVHDTPNSKFLMETRTAPPSSLRKLSRLMSRTPQTCNLLGFCQRFQLGPHIRRPSMCSFGVSGHP